FLDPKTLPTAGTYRILIDPQGAATGSMTLSLYDVPPDVTASIAAGGAPVAAAATTPGQNARLTFDGQAGRRVRLHLSAPPITTPGQNARITFAGRAGQHVTLQLSAVSVLISYVAILKPDGTALGPSTLVTTSGRTIAADLPADGTYSIAIDPLGPEIGAMTL